MNKHYLDSNYTKNNVDIFTNINTKLHLSRYPLMIPEAPK